MKNNRPMLNIYPDSLSNNLAGAVDVLKRKDLFEAFSDIYILPSMFNTDLDRGFSVIDYNLNSTLVQPTDIEELKSLGLNLKLDFILNHASVLSPQFQDLLINKQNSKYKDFFINWNDFFKGNGSMNEDGLVIPNEEVIEGMFFRKPGLPVLEVLTKGTPLYYWNTFYQEVKVNDITIQEIMKSFNIQYNQATLIKRKIDDQISSGIALSNISVDGYDVRSMLMDKVEYLGQMDLNIKSTLVWEFYNDVLSKFKNYGASIVRLDAFAYASKEIGYSNFMNMPHTFDILDRLNDMSKEKGLSLLPEIHANYEDGVYKLISDKGYQVYDFFLPGLLIDTLESQDCTNLVKWGEEIIRDNIDVVNMLGCHDGIPILDLKGLLEEDRIKSLVELIVSRGGYIKELHGQENIYYQVNATYFSALGEDEAKMILARAIQLFMPGKPQVWYLDLFMGTNNYDAIKFGHKEINRTNLNDEFINTQLENECVKKQIDLLKFRNNHKAFNSESKITFENTADGFNITWNYQDNYASLYVDLMNYTFNISSN